MSMNYLFYLLILNKNAEDLEYFLELSHTLFITSLLSSREQVILYDLARARRWSLSRTLEWEPVSTELGGSLLTCARLRSNPGQLKRLENVLVPGLGETGALVVLKSAFLRPKLFFSNLKPAPKSIAR